MSRRYVNAQRRQVGAGAAIAADGLHLSHEALKKTKGSANGDKLLAVMKGMYWNSVRGCTTLCPGTDIVQGIHIGGAKRADGQIWNVEFDKIAHF